MDNVSRNPPTQKKYITVIKFFNNTDTDFPLQGVQGSEMDVSSFGPHPITTLLTTFNFQVLLQQ